MEKLLCAVDIDDNILYEITKDEAHRKGILHRAFSVVLYNKDAILLQKRAANKYHCGGLWSNTCCSHPGPHESIEISAKKRLNDELGIVDVGIYPFGSIMYYYEFTNGLKEYEYDHIYLGEFNGEVHINKDEVSEIKWIDANVLKSILQKHPEKFTPWFIIMFSKIYPYIMKKNGESCNESKII